MLIVDNIKKGFKTPSGKLTVLNDISLHVKEGEFIVIQGPSGIGKTTLLLIIGALLAPDDGEIVLNGQNPYLLSENKRAEFRSANIGFVFQQFYLMPYLNVLDNVLVPSLATSYDKAKSKLLARARSLIEEFALTERIGHFPSQLSAGEKQRVALIRALLRCPKLILADEPTGNLDENNANIVISRLKDFARTGGIVILATHDNKLVKFGDRVISLLQ